MIDVLLFGICGRMGRLAAEEISKADDLKLIAGVEYPGHQSLGSTVSGVLVQSDQDDYPAADIWFDFSLAAPATDHIERAALRGIPVVIGVTGFSTAQMETIRKHSSRIPILLAPNLSAGMGLMENLTSSAARLLPRDFETAIFELHHNRKKDVPSGTAKRLSDVLTEVGISAPITSMRAGGAVGEHQVRLVGESEEIVITHRAWSRKAFSSGVVPAIRFLIGRGPGLYTTADIYRDS
jgi:4-hydroxy-tetrahydrodipicolinate reductase